MRSELTALFFLMKETNHFRFRYRGENIKENFREI
jgi:hypothetical protein